MKSGKLTIYSFDETAQRIADRLISEEKEGLSCYFSDIEISSQQLSIPDNSFVETRQQYKARPFLTSIRKQHKTGHALGLVDLDLFTPDLNFILGVAQYGGDAIVALARLKTSFYHQPLDEAIFFKRTVKEVYHELGHVLGLRHCNNYCVMRFSNSLQDTDNKPRTYCSKCRSELQT